MRVALVNSQDSEGGAARSAYRLLKGLNSIGLHASLFVQHKTKDDFLVCGSPGNLNRTLAWIRAKIDSSPLRAYRHRHSDPWSLNWLPNLGVIRALREKDIDIAHLHWVGGGFVPIGALKKLNKPLVATTIMVADSSRLAAVHAHN
jgi:hypothetical protein